LLETKALALDPTLSRPLQSLQKTRQTRNNRDRKKSAEESGVGWSGVEWSGGKQSEATCHRGNHAQFNPTKVPHFQCHRAKGDKKKPKQKQQPAEIRNLNLNSALDFI